MLVSIQWTNALMKLELEKNPPPVLIIFPGKKVKVSTVRFESDFVMTKL